MAKRLVRPSELDSQAGLSPPADAPEPTPSQGVSKWNWEKALKAGSLDAGMSPSMQHVALLLSTYANGDGSSIRPTIKTLMAVSGRSRTTVTDALRWLREHGWVQQVSQGQGATGKASEYQLSLPEGMH